jgi:hypothetical protein
MDRWLSAGPALEAERLERLAKLDPERAAAAVAAVLDLAASAPRTPWRWTHSGLVEQQALFARSRRPGP